MPTLLSSPSLFIGLMSGTSLDGVDGVLASFPEDDARPHILASTWLPFAPALRAELLALQGSGENEIEREALAANGLARLYAECVAALLQQAGLPAREIAAIGAHGQTIRHQPGLGYTRQSNNPALLAELAGIDVVADFRSRDIAAGGQGAPLVPAFHRAIFASKDETRVVANIGGIANISILDRDPAVVVTGFDTGPGNMLLDAWCLRHRGLPYDADGAWAASGRLLPALLDSLRGEAFFALQPPKSTGRDLFHMQWLESHLANFPGAAAADVQATLCALSATTLAAALAAHAPDARTLYVCGGGAYNRHLMELLEQALRAEGMAARVASTAELGVPPNQVEGLAFAWLARQFCRREAGNLPAVTGASGKRILGALYPA